MRETLYIAGAIWVPILCVIAVLAIVIPVYFVGLVLQRAGQLIILLGTWLQERLERWMHWD